MAGLPRGTDSTRPRSAFSVVMLDGFERLTTALRRGDPFSEDGLQDMLLLRSRTEAFAAALDARLRQHGMSDPLLEESE